MSLSLKVTSSRGAAGANKIDADTSQASKENSAKVIEELGGSATQQAHQDNPVSKSAADKLEGTRAAAA